MPARCFGRRPGEERAVVIGKYAVCGERTPARDMNDLAKMGLVEKLSKRTYRARREVIEAFIPPVAP